MTVRVTVWNEFQHELTDEAVKKHYPKGIHVAVADFMNQAGLKARTATLAEPEHGLTEAVLKDTDVLTWWGHQAHDQVSDAVVDRVQKRVLEGMGLIVMHSGHFSKIFKRMMGTNCSLQWREASERQRIFTIEPSHPIAEGLPDHFELPNVEMYGERFDIPTPDKLVFLSWYEGGNVFRSGCTWERGHGRIFYFEPGHETFPIYHDKNIQKVLINAARWAAPRITRVDDCPNVAPLEAIKPK
jgi:trehalose utilization protein